MILNTKCCGFFQCNFVEYLPDFINALFEYLADEKADIHVNAERVLDRFLSDVRADPTAVELNKMVNFLILHAQASVVKAKFILSYHFISYSCRQTMYAFS